MASTTVPGKYVPLGTNHANQAYVDAVAPAMVDTDTLFVTPPEGVDADLVPVSAICYAPDSSGVLTVNTNIGITSHDKGTSSGTPGTTLTATGVIASGSTVRIGYLGASPP